MNYMVSMLYRKIQSKLQTENMFDILQYKVQSSKPYVRLSLSRTVEFTSESIKKSGLTVGKIFFFKLYLLILFSVAEIGGFVGMILGISLMDLEYFLHKVFGVLSNQFNKSKF